MEVWKPIPGFEGRYEASDHGQIRSVTTRDARGVVHLGIVRKQMLNEAGYYTLMLSDGAKKHPKLVHQLICATFNGPRGDNYCVRHLDGDQKNNMAGNLAWGSLSDNSWDSVRHGTHPQASKVECPRGHDLVEPNLVPSVAKTGRRQCLACSRGMANAQTARKLGRMIDLAAVCDAHFRAIMSQPLAA